MRRLLVLCSVLIAAWSLEPLVQQAHAQDSSASGERGKSRAKRAKRAKKNKRAVAPAPEPAAAAPAVDGSKTEAKVPGAPDTQSAAPVPESKASASSAISADEGQVRKEGDTEVKTLEFTGLDIDGQLKTPQLLYFLTRLRAEFDRPRLPHRSFMPELRRTPGEKSLR